MTRSIYSLLLFLWEKFLARERDMLLAECVVHLKEFCIAVRVKYDGFNLIASNQTVLERVDTRVGWV